MAGSWLPRPGIMASASASTPTVTAGRRTRQPGLLSLQLSLMVAPPVAGSDRPRVLVTPQDQLQSAGEVLSGGILGTVADRSVGVEEELLLVDPASGHARAVAGAVMEAADGPAASPADRAGLDSPAEVLEFELQLEQLETGTRPCGSLEEVSREVRRCRSVAAEAAARVGVQVAAIGTSPMAVEPSLTRTEQVPAAGSRVRPDRAGAADLRMPRARAGRLGRGRGRGARPHPSVACAAARAERQLSFLAGTRQRVRELQVSGLGAVAVFRANRICSGQRARTTASCRQWWIPARSWTRA